MPPHVRRTVADSGFEIHVDPTVVMEHWNAIRATPRYFFQTPQWMTSLIAQTDGNSMLFSFTDQGRPVLVTHLLRSTYRRYGISLTAVSSPGHLSELRLYCDGLSVTDPASVSLADIVANAGAWHVLRLERIRLGSPWLDISGIAGRFEEEPTQGVGVLDTTRPPDTWWSQLPRNMRNSVKRSRSRARQMGGTSVETFRGAGIPYAFEQYVALEATQQKHSWGTSLSQQPRFSHLLRDYLASVDSSQVRHLLINGRLAACQLGVIVDRTYFLLKIAYDPELAQFSPGNLLMADLVEACCTDSHIDRIDCTVWQPWHERWGMVREPTFAFTAFNRNTVRGRAARMTSTLRHQING